MSKLLVCALFVAFLFGCSLIESVQGQWYVNFWRTSTKVQFIGVGPTMVPIPTTEDMATHTMAMVMATVMASVRPASRHLPSPGQLFLRVHQRILEVKKLLHLHTHLHWSLRNNEVIKKSILSCNINGWLWVKRKFIHNFCVHAFWVFKIFRPSSFTSLTASSTLWVVLFELHTAKRKNEMPCVLDDTKWIRPSSLMAAQSASFSSLLACKMQIFWCVQLSASPPLNGSRPIPDAAAQIIQIETHRLSATIQQTVLPIQHA